MPFLSAKERCRIPGLSCLFISRVRHALCSDKMTS